MQPTSTQQTRKSNAQKHPGLPDTPAKRRTHQEKIADDARKMEHQMMQENQAFLTLANVASVEEEMEVTQSAKWAPKKGVPPAKQRVSAKGSVKPADIPKDLPHLDTSTDHHAAVLGSGPRPKESSSHNGLGLPDLIAVVQARRQRAKQLVLAAASKVHSGGDATQPQVDGSELDKTEPNCKSQVLARVKQWTTRVQDEHATIAARQGSPSATSSTPTSVPSTVLSSSTQSSAATTVVDETEHDVKMADEDAPHGGFREDGDDSLEHEDATIKVRKGKGKQVAVVELTQVPPVLTDGLVRQKRKHHDGDDAPDFAHIDDASGWKGDLSGQETEPDEPMEEEIVLPGTPRRLTHASRFTNQSCLNVLAQPPKKVKQDPTARTTKSHTTPALVPRLTFTASNTLRSVEMVPQSPTPRQIVTPCWRPLDYTPGPQAETSSSSVQGRHSKASLPIELQADGGNDDVWSVTCPAVSYALPFFVSYDKDLDPSTMDFDYQGPIVSVANQRLCDWRHNIGSTALAIIMTFMQCASSDREARDIANMLLEDLAFLYKDLDASDPKKAFRSQFMLQLLNMAHLQYMNGAMDKPMIPVHPSLGNYGGVIALCGAALERALWLVKQGLITWRTIQAFEGRIPTPRTLNEYSSRGKHNDIRVLGAELGHGDQETG